MPPLWERKNLRLPRSRLIYREQTELDSQPGRIYAELYRGLDRREYAAIHVQNLISGAWRVVRLRREDLDALCAAWQRFKEEEARERDRPDVPAPG